MPCFNNKELRTHHCWFIFLSLFILILGSCSKTVLFTSEPDGVLIQKEHGSFMLPIEVEINRNSTYTFIHSRYETQTISGQEILDAGTDTWNVDMGVRFHEIKFIGLGNVGSIYIDGEIHSSNKAYRPSGTYTIVMEKPGYQTQEITLDLQQDEMVLFEQVRYYSIIEIPNGVSAIEFNGEDISLEDQFLLEHDQNLLTVYFGSERKDYYLNQNGDYFFDNKINLEMLVLTYITVELGDWNELFLLDGSWIKPISGIYTLATLSQAGTGLSNYQLPKTEVNRIVREPQGIFPDISIGQPTEELLGAQVVLSTSTEEMVIEITENFYKENLESYHSERGYNSEGESDDEVEILRISSLDFGAPFHDEKCQIRIINNGILLDHVEFTKSDSLDMFRTIDFSIYNRPRNSFFHVDSLAIDEDIFYFYASPELEGQYLVVYQRDLSSSGHFPPPVLVAKLEEVDKSPIEICLIGSANSGVFDAMIISSFDSLYDFHTYYQPTERIFGSLYR